MYNLIAFFAEICYNTCMDQLKYHFSLMNYDYLLDNDPTSQERKNEYYLHMHNDYEILFFFGGNADYVIENKLYHLKKNTLMFIKPMVYHGLNVLSNAPYERAVFNFSQLAVPYFLQSHISGLKSQYTIKENSPIYSLFAALREYKHIFEPKEFEQLKKSSLLNLLSMLHYASAADIEQPEPVNNGVLDRIIEYINANPDQNLNTQVLSDLFFVSKSWIDHAFKKQLKTSPKNYINHKKVLYAQSLILDGKSIAEIVETCNYENYSTFYRQYKFFLKHEPAYDKLLYNETHKKK